MNDIVERLRGTDPVKSWIEADAVMEQAADEIDRLRARVAELESFIIHEIKTLEYNQRGSTHWDGCETRHHDCAAIKRMRAAIDAARGDK